MIAKGKQLDTSKDPRWLGPNAMADYLSVSPRTLFVWRQEGRVPFLKIKGRVIFEVRAVEAALRKFEIKALTGSKQTAAPVFHAKGDR